MKYDGGKNLFSRVIPMGTVTFRDAQSLDQIHSCRSTTAHSRSTISSHKYSLIVVCMADRALYRVNST